ncbi:MAG: protocatechuate 3,4-dioxygenase subunit alpha [Actinobacteria bacterium]|nr:protocatechuate 3,4-dioxygenase subunit alpha [Actinomycetota bacterium]
MARLGETPSQTVGPFFSIGLSGEGENVLVSDGVAGDRIRLVGRVLDGDGRPVGDALIELWQANSLGRYRHPDDARGELPLDPAFTGFGRAATGFETGEYWFETIKPGPVPDPEGELQAPHLNLIVQARGTLNPLFTRVYFPDEEEANQSDLVLAMVPKDRRETLVAVPEGGEPAVYRFDIHLQGEGQTVFLDI